MSSDVMIVCKEFNNSYRNYTKENNYTVDIPAICIDEASMGEPWTEFGKWFVEKYYNGYSMLETLVMTRNGSQDDVDKMQSAILDTKFTEVDYEAVCIALEKMQTKPDLNKEKLKEYLKKCIGNSISTENW